MSSISRRNVLGTAALGAGGLVMPAMAKSADGNLQLAQLPGSPPLAEPAPPVLAGTDLPSFRFAMEAQQGKVGNGGVGKEATVVEFPVSQDIAGVSMRLDPGTARELHWHATAAEWAYVISGRCRISVLDTQGHSEILDFGPGDVWYFPRGHGHSIQGIGSEPCHFILVFDNGYFSEFGTFSITDWLGHTPPEILSQTLGVPADSFSAIPKGEVYFAKGPVPGPLPEYPPPASETTGPLTHRYRLNAHKPREFGGGSIKLVTVKDFPISTTICGATMLLKPGALREPHWHPNAAEWQYYIGGRGRMTVFGSHGRIRTDEFEPGDVGYVPQGYGHYIESIGNQDCEILLAFNNGNYEEISLSDWLASNQPLLLETHFGLPESVIAKFPKRSVFITSGKS